MFVNVTTKSAQHAHARMIAIIVEKSPNSSDMYDHGFMGNTNCQAVCKSQKNPLSDSQTAEEWHLFIYSFIYWFTYLFIFMWIAIPMLMRSMLIQAWYKFHMVLRNSYNIVWD